MSVDKEQVRAAVEQSFEDSENMKKMISSDASAGDPMWDALMARVNASNRARMWDIFAEEAWRHIENYTVPQYGDFPDDQVAKWDEEQLKTQIEKYLNRLSSSSRGEQESNMDLIKIAHYAQLIWSKRLGFEEAFKQVIEERKDNGPE